MADGIDMAVIERRLEALELMPGLALPGVRPRRRALHEGQAPGTIELATRSLGITREDDRQ